MRIVNTEEVSNELIYYNLDVINSSQVDAGTGSDPIMKFEETRSTPILTDASKYNFSIVRFTINGANKDLPLFIPIANKNQFNTSEAVVVSGTNNKFNISFTPDNTGQGYLTNFTLATGTYTPSAFVSYVNGLLTTWIAGLPATTYKPVSITFSLVPNSNFLRVVLVWNTPPASNTGLVFNFQNGVPPQCFPGNWELFGQFVYPNGAQVILFTADMFAGGVSAFTTSTQPVQESPYQQLNTIYDTIYSITLAGSYNNVVFTPITKFITWYPETTDIPQPALNADGTINQQVSDKYWWCYTYKHWVDCVNRTIADAFSALQTQLSATFKSLPPVLSYNPSTNSFSIAFDSFGFGCNTNTYLNAIATSLQPGYTLDIVSPINQDQRLCNQSGANNENFSLFFNSNMFGLFSNFNNIYYGLESVSNNGMDNLIVCSNEQTSSYNPYVFNNTSGTITTQSANGNTLYPKVLYIVNQDYPSTSSLWSPISSIVFCSTLLPTLPENISAPVVLNSGNNTAQNTSLNAFTPIITDIALPMATAGDYRQFISYTPSAEYRLTSLGTSQVDVREMNISVFWKHRLTGELVPITLFNQSSVSLKILFRRRNAGK